MGGVDGRITGAKLDEPEDVGRVRIYDFGDGEHLIEVLRVLRRRVHVEDVGDELPHVSPDTVRLLREALVVMVEGVRVQGHELEAQDQIVPRVDVVAAPYVEHVALLAVDDQRDDGGHRPRGGAVGHLALAALLLGAAHDAEGPDTVPDEMDDVVESERILVIRRQLVIEPLAGLVDSGRQCGPIVPRL